MKESIYHNIFQRAFVVGLIQERINYLEECNARKTDKNTTEYMHNDEEIKSLKNFLFWNS